MISAWSREKPNMSRTKNPTFALRLPKSMKAEATQAAIHDEISLNAFILLAIAEKIARSQSKVPLVN